MTGKDAAKNSIGIMGGTFDPVHFGHLVAAEAACHEFKLKKVIFVPTGRPPHKQGLNITPVQDRLAMTRLAIKDNADFELSEVETSRDGFSYTIDTMKYFNKIYKDTNLFFITGADAILEIISWKNVRELISICSFIAVTRPGFVLDQVYQVLPEDFLAKINFLEVPGLAISSTEIRQRVKEGRSIRYLLPEYVEEYIKANRLYR